ncbi:unnamed protein product [Gongylonema pulchrum]|uniref:Secreted protein n=1 Tax=Gongylonema pulchrum TaxID=637853 RepID=A0A183E2E8_9BILA|nr:unnamed protein product [Gongylonema pulchrum]
MLHEVPIQNEADSRVEVLICVVVCKLMLLLRVEPLIRVTPTVDVIAHARYAHLFNIEWRSLAPLAGSIQHSRSTNDSAVR